MERFIQMLQQWAFPHVKKLVKLLIYVVFQNIHVLNAEPSFLPHLFKLHAAFPKLRIVLEHATTRAAVEAVKLCGPMVACTITAHHLALTVDDWAGQSWNFCKPVAKYPDDRQALRDVVKEGKPNWQDKNTRQKNWDFWRTSSIFPWFRLCAPSSTCKINEHTNAGVCSGRLYFSHFAAVGRSPLGVFRGAWQIGRLCKRLWKEFLQPTD